LRNVAAKKFPNLTVLAKDLMRYLVTNFIVRFFGPPGVYIYGLSYVIYISELLLALDWALYRSSGVRNNAAITTVKAVQI